ncbi:MAG TPA: toxin-antitoxin system TumE family protein [Candidatus Avalokitesvara rifleensis]|uniref:toxin-antitoxin system TumE family protein n=1 Tax=Candidatus Avalokitesvara rifleensis TaxID=3367620 RepID=UPI0027133535|nr:DUF6516 family protein [Candidatus Brocadiales bacterium]
MEARLIRHNKGYDVDGNLIEVKMWEVKATPDKPHGYKYSLVYIVKSVRVIGYDNAEGRGDHRHYGDRTESYRFEGLEKLAEDFYSDIQKYREGRL